MFYSTFLKDNSTASPPMFTNAQLKALLLPLLLEQFLSVSMGLADTVMVSGVGEAAVSSVSLVDSLNVLIIQILSALATGGAVVASQSGTCRFRCRPEFRWPGSGGRWKNWALSLPEKRSAADCHGAAVELSFRKVE
jgi:hypothetical protein